MQIAYDFKALIHISEDYTYTKFHYKNKVYWLVYPPGICGYLMPVRPQQQP